jgi:2-hydroxy-6-oxonona-2,4-dienedioate hydrolase
VGEAARVNEIERVGALGDKLETPCGNGAMIWRRWGKGPPIVLLHGGFGSWTHWIRNVEAFAATRTVLAPDMPGMGDSAMPPIPYTAESIAEIVSAGIDALFGDEPADLMGFSFGGIIGGVVAAQRGDHVRRLSLVGANGFGALQPPALDLKRAQPWMSNEQVVELQKANLAMLMIADPKNIDTLAIRIHVENTARGRIRSRPVSRSDTLAAVLPEIDAEIVGIWGERDATVVPMLAERIVHVKQLRPDAVTHVLPHAGHWVQYEAAPAFNAAFACR